MTILLSATVAMLPHLRRTWTGPQGTTDQAQRAMPPSKSDQIVAHQITALESLRDAPNGAPAVYQIALFAQAWYSCGNDGAWTGRTEVDADERRCVLDGACVSTPGLVLHHDVPCGLSLDQTMLLCDAGPERSGPGAVGAGIFPQLLGVRHLLMAFFSGSQSICQMGYPCLSLSDHSAWTCVCCFFGVPICRLLHPSTDVELPVPGHPGARHFFGAPGEPLGPLWSTWAPWTLARGTPLGETFEPQHPTNNYSAITTEYHTIPHKTTRAAPKHPRAA